ncbi:hypothetical protein [Shewanella acanthi]|uniref:hypothetical protein n=1 Tax=Shewanella acanthi TaxID=2864212 RepID=UPI0021AC0E04|nr:hypothetical protein [Shewanella acanthi]
MKYLAFIALTFLTATSTVSAKTLKIFGDVQVTNVKPTEAFIWERSNKETPLYPIELAKAKIRG